jgi:hypothetical protein
MWPNNFAMLHHMLGSLLVLIPIRRKDCQMLAIRFLQIPKWLYPNMITFLWYNERMDMKAKSLIIEQMLAGHWFLTQVNLITDQFVLDLLTTSLIDNCLVLNSLKFNNLPRWPDYTLTRKEFPLKTKLLFFNQAFYFVIGKKDKLG